MLDLPEAQADVLDSIRAGVVTLSALMIDTGRTFAGVRSALAALHRGGHIAPAGKVATDRGQSRAMSWRVADGPPRAARRGRPREAKARQDLLWSVLGTLRDGASVESLCMACDTDERSVRWDLSVLRKEGRARWNGRRGNHSRWFALDPSGGAK